MGGPNRERALRLYSEAAGSYDSRVTALLGRYRRRAVERLELSPGETVLDVACGTGANFELVRERVGAEGRIVGVDLSPEMLKIARRRVARESFHNVRLVEGAIEEVDLDQQFDAVLFSLTHDVLQSPQALSNLRSVVKPEARVASFGAKWAPAWRLPVNWVVRRVSGRYVTTFDGLHEPWANLARIVPDLTVEPVALGGAYIASGRFV